MDHITIMKTPEVIISCLESIPKDKQMLVLPSGRTIKDVIVHLAGWQLEATDCFTSLCENGTSPWFYGKADVTEFNEKLNERYKHLTYSDAVDLLKNSYLERSTRLSKYGKIKLLEVGLGWMFEDNIRSHDIKHIEQIKKVLRG